MLLHLLSIVFWQQQEQLAVYYFLCKIKIADRSKPFLSPRSSQRNTNKIRHAPTTTTDNKNDDDDDGENSRTMEDDEPFLTQPHAGIILV